MGDLIQVQVHRGNLMFEGRKDRIVDIYRDGAAIPFDCTVLEKGVPVTTETVSAVADRWIAAQPTE